MVGAWARTGTGTEPLSPSEARRVLEELSMASRQRNKASKRGGNITNMHYSNAHCSNEQGFYP